MTVKNVENRTIFEGDNLHILRRFDSETIDLIYLDPPFNSKGKCKGCEVSFYFRNMTIDHIHPRSKYEIQNTYAVTEPYRKRGVLVYEK